MLWAMMLALGTCEVLQPSSTENIRSAAIAIPHNLVANATQAKIFLAGEPVRKFKFYTNVCTAKIVSII